MIKFLNNIVAFLLITPFALSDSKALDSEDGVQFVHILHRHGDRNPYPYPADVWKDKKYWPDGYGSLTDIGKLECCELGTFLRKRYRNLIEKNGVFNPNSIYIRSSNVSRTILSAKFVSTCMLSAQDGPFKEVSEILLSSIPIHSTPPKMDYVLYLDKNCPLHRQKYEEYKNSDEILSILRKYKALLQYLERHSGMRMQSINSVLSLYDVLDIERLKGFELPAWTNDVFFPDSDMEYLSNFRFTMDTSSKLLARLNAGFLIHEILIRFTMKKDSKLSPHWTVYEYSAHDFTIANVLNALGLFEPVRRPAYASCVLFELHKYKEIFYVMIFYKRNDGTDETPLKPLFIPSCGYMCPLDEMYVIYNDILPTDYFETECEIDHKQSNNSKNLFTLMTNDILNESNGIIKANN